MVGKYVRGRNNGESYNDYELLSSVLIIQIAGFTRYGSLKKRGVRVSGFSQRATLAPLHLANAAAQSGEMNEKRPHPAPHLPRPYANKRSFHSPLPIASHRISDQVSLNYDG